MPQIAKFMGPTWGPLGSSWAPCWPHEPCYQGLFCTVSLILSLTDVIQKENVDNRHSLSRPLCINSRSLRQFLIYPDDCFNIQISCLTNKWISIINIRPSYFPKVNTILRKTVLILKRAHFVTYFMACGQCSASIYPEGPCCPWTAAGPPNAPSSGRARLGDDYKAPLRFVIMRYFSDNPVLSLQRGTVLCIDFSIMPLT